jgi:cytidylate kinase
VKDIVTLSGDIGGGKSSVGRILAAALSFKLISAGGIQREIAASMGLTTLQLNELSAKDRSVDDRIDSHTKMLGETTEHIIVDSRLAWHFIPDAYKVFLSVDALVGASRVFDASRADEHHSSLQNALENNLTRAKLEVARFRTLYGIEMRDYRNYDLVVDTSYASPGIVAQTIERAFHAKRAGQPTAQCWMSPKRLLDAPIADVSNTANEGVVTIRTIDGVFVIASGRAKVEAALREGAALIPAALVS